MIYTVLTCWMLLSIIVYRIYHKPIHVSVFPSNTSWSTLHLRFSIVISIVRFCPITISFIDSLMITWWCTCWKLIFFTFFTDWIQQEIKVITHTFAENASQARLIPFLCNKRCLSCKGSQRDQLAKLQPTQDKKQRAGIRLWVGEFENLWHPIMCLHSFSLQQKMSFLQGIPKRSTLPNSRMIPHLACGIASI